MKIVVLAGGLSPERNVSLSTGTMVTEALRGQGHRAALVDLYFGLEDDAGALEELFDADVSAAAKRISRQAPDLEQVKAARRDKSPSLFGPNVLELCRLADVVFLALHGACGEDGGLDSGDDENDDDGLLPAALLRSHFFAIHDRLRVPLTVGRSSTERGSSSGDG